MKIEIENLDGHFKKLHVEIPPDVVAQYVEREFEAIREQAELKGFRKGKAPLKVIKEMYGSLAGDRAAREIVESKLREALKEKSLLPVSMPQIDLKPIKENEPFKFSAHFENEPPVELKSYDSFEVEAESAEVDPAEVEKVVENLLSQGAEYVPDLMAERVAKGHIVEIDYDANEGGTPFAEASDKGALFELGAGTLFQQFEENLMGMTVGEQRVFSVSFPMPENESERVPVSGKTLEFAVRLNAIKKKQLPERNDEWAKKFGATDLAGLLSKIGEEQVKEKKRATRTRNREKVVETLLAKNPVEAAATMVDNQVRELAMEAGMNLSRRGMPQDQMEAKLKEWAPEIQQRATQQVKASMLLSAIATKENIQATDEDFRQELARMAAQSGRQATEVLKDLRERNLIGGLLRQIAEVKALDWLVERALKL